MCKRALLLPDVAVCSNYQAPPLHCSVTKNHAEPSTLTLPLGIALMYKMHLFIRKWFNLIIFFHSVLRRAVWKETNIFRAVVPKVAKAQQISHKKWSSHISQKDALAT